MTRTVVYDFQKRLGGLPTPCTSCSSTDSSWHIVAIMSGDTLVDAYCEGCVQDIANAMKGKASQPQVN